ncbi:MAG: GTPase/DUF3482 domain-containing protein [Gammaproteobacteria bacterium]|nr:GTPase/DUF3482 domain-containing protein [Gammaproteobacteria bacterium]
MSSTAPLQLAVVGHTNVGKTSLMRTLLRDAAFGDVAPTAATTRQIEAAQLLAEGRPVVELYDTPGLEDASGLIGFLEPDAVERHAGPERVARFLDSADAGARFEQEARVLAQMLDSDAAVYVIDVREPVLGKYQDELAILGLCARPILPLLNFTADPSGRLEEWRAALARVGLHAIAEFDTVVYSIEAESRFWRRLATLADSHAAGLEALLAERTRRAADLHVAALRMLAELLIDAAGARREAAREDEASFEREQVALQRAVEQRERSFVHDLLGLYRFPQDALELLPLPLARDGWRAPLFDPVMLEWLGKRAGGGLAAGAAAGAAVDVATGGLSLGIGTVVGSLIGGGGGAAWTMRDQIVSRVRGVRILAVSDAALGHLGARALALVRALEQRGHAAQSPMQWQKGLPKAWPGERVPPPLTRARHSPRSSTLNGPAGAVRDELAEQLAQMLRG